MKFSTTSSKIAEKLPRHQEPKQKPLRLVIDKWTLLQELKLNVLYQK